jgi:hypothetical protein
MSPRFLCVLILLVLQTSTLQVLAQEVQAQKLSEENVNFFETRVRPVLVERCFACHAGDAVESDFNVDSLAGILAGGARGPAVVPGEPEASLLILAINHADQLHMPPKTKISAREIADLTTWVKLGAPWPDAEPRHLSATSTSSDVAVFSAAEREFWAFQPPQISRTTCPDAAGIRSPIDQFVISRLEEQGLRPAPPADRRTLIRRATFDLTGLPPSIEEVDHFLSDDSPNAFERLVDRLLASPRYGERWGRRWLDVARYADSNGLDENLAYANAFQYRDYVINAFNKDKPYDRFVMEQICGDLIAADDPRTSPFERIAATGFLALGAKMLAEDDPVKMQMDIIDEQVDTIGRAIMGLTLGCARCHDHKFDPIPTSDYYSLAGIFKSTKTMENFTVVARWQELPLAAPAQLEEKRKAEERVAAKQAEIDSLAKQGLDRTLADSRANVGHYLLAALETEQLDKLISRATTYGNDPGASEIEGLRIIEAEDYDRGNVTKDRADYGKGIGVLVNRGELPNFAEYDVNVEQGGAFQLELRYAAAAARPCRLSINGKTVKPDAARSVTGSWFPDQQAWEIQGFFRLRDGNNVIRLDQPQFFPHIDKLLLAPTSHQLPDALEAPTTSDYEPQPTFIRQWQAYLKANRDSADSVFRAWHFVTGKVQSPGGTGDPMLADGPTPTIQHVALRYQNRCRTVKRDWEAAQASSGDPTPDRLENPLDERLRAVLYDPAGPFAVPESYQYLLPTSVTQRLRQLTAERAALEGAVPQHPTAMSVTDAEPEDLRIHIRGSHVTLGKVAPRRFPRILAGSNQPDLGSDSSGRLEFARWLTNPSHPLTARVIVNRIWLGHFGEGLVSSPDNFGRLGKRPTHPELLDYLTVRFVEKGWSIKWLHRTVMASAMYQMSTAWNEQFAELDPANRWLWRMNRRRLDAEEIRDSLLEMGGSLDLSMGGSMLPTKNRGYVTSTANVDPVAYQTNRRSIYLPVVRSALYEILRAFDFADPSYLSGKRQATTVAPQALFIMNSQLVAEQSKALAVKLLSDSRFDDRGRLRRVYLSAYGRPPSDLELSRALAHIEQYASDENSQGSPEQRRLKAWQSLVRAIFAANEFIYVE